MLMAIIEYEAHPGTEEEFTSLLGDLDAQLETIAGFISADAATSIKHGGMLYEVSYWRDAEALATWARDPVHGVAMKAGRDRLLKWYRIRVGEVTRDWSVGDIPPENPAAC